MDKEGGKKLQLKILKYKTAIRKLEKDLAKN